MKVVTFSDLRKNLATVLDGVIDDHSPVLITRQNKKTAVLISLDDFNAYEETAYLMSNQANAAHLMKSIAQAKAGKTQQHELIEE